MRPNTVSATSLHVASLCMKRYEAEYIKYGRGFQGDAAKVGSVCHSALENYVKAVYVDKSAKPELGLLLEFSRTAFVAIFNNGDFSSEFYLDAEQMLTEWHGRADFSDREVLSLEQKDRYPIALSDGTTLPVTYIMDRVDYCHSRESIVIVDYKTNRAPMNHDELRGKIQPRIYALIKQIQEPDAKQIGVEYDLLRHGLIGVVYTKQQNLNTWNWLMSEVGRILATPESPAPTLNPECHYCPIKARCPAILANINVGGIMSMSPSELVDYRALFEGQSKAAAAALAEIDSVLGPLLRDKDRSSDHIDGNLYTATIRSGRGSRSVDGELVARMAPREVYDEYAPPSKITIGAFDKMLKDERITPEMAARLRSLVSKNPGASKITVEPRIP